MLDATSLTKPELVKKYMMGADVKSDWKVGSPLTYTGVYKDKPFEEKGVIRKIERVTWELNEKDGATAVTVSRDGISTETGVEAAMPTGRPC